MTKQGEIAFITKNGLIFDRFDDKSLTLKDQ